jgi:hypothetical protein
MNPTDRFATSAVELATVHLIAPERVMTEAEVEYCVSSGYVRATDQTGHTLITHISNVVIEMQ